MSRPYRPGHTLCRVLQLQPVNDILELLNLSGKAREKPLRRTYPRSARNAVRLMTGRVVPVSRRTMRVLVALAAVACRPPASVVALEDGIVPGLGLPTTGATMSWDRRAEDAAILVGPERRRDFYDDHWTLTITPTVAEQAAVAPRPRRPPGVVAVALLGVVGLLAFLGLAVFATLRERESAGLVAITRTNRAVTRE